MAAASDVGDIDFLSAELALGYVKLQVLVGEGPLSRYVPLVPVAVRSEGIVIALPAEVIPWVRAQLAYLADAETGQPSDDAQTVAVAFLVVGHLTAAVPYWRRGGLELRRAVAGFRQPRRLA
eukprot:4890727-Lingulodinium_polyedra.AAC.1